MKKTLTALRYLLLFAVGVALMYFAFLGQDFSDLKDKLQNADYFYVAISLVMSMVAYWSRAIRWKLLLEPLGHYPKASNTFIALMVGYLANLALPRLGEVLRCTLLNRLDKVPVEACLGTVVAERVFDMIMLALVLGATLLLEFDLLSGFLMSIFSGKLNTPNENTSNSIYWILAGVAVLGLVFMWLMYRYHSFLQRYMFYAKATSFALGVGKGLVSVKNLRNPWSFVLHTLIIWVMYYGMTYIVFFAIPETSGLGWQSGMAILVIGGLGMAAPVQGGIGAFHWLVSKGLMLYGVSEVIGLSLATLLHGSQVVGVLIVGGFCLLWSIVRLRGEKAAGLKSSV